ncbi:uncharacterized protein LOC121765967 [Salvia splendens]|uniref:uncharacterized protein LOC121765967 n=1 Tax=Salvia splendens TaxID=180675 RepID=UPI001C27481E|nr:uncharacterized protein LOC121765967 [Salvia splendens]XP_042018202.1 uncharacterized protein LOC121765967 [Salvia splendens]XP_042018203.1 uncharacterized protein LOC121765967 [Salvia splendens]
MGYKRKSMKKPAYFMDVQWTTYTDAWKLPENIKVCERCSTNRRQGREKAFGTHCNGCITFEETVENMTEENNWILPTFVDVFGKTYTFRTIDSHGMVSQNATQFNDDIMRRAEELRAEGIDNPDLDAIFLELHGKVKKREQIPGAGSVTKLYFPSATSAYASGRLTGGDPRKMDKLYEQQLREERERMEARMEERVRKIEEVSEKKMEMMKEQMQEHILFRVWKAQILHKGVDHVSEHPKCARKNWSIAWKRARE